MKRAWHQFSHLEIKFEIRILLLDCLYFSFFSGSDFLEMLFLLSPQNGFHVRLRVFQVEFRRHLFRLSSFIQLGQYLNLLVFVQFWFEGQMQTLFQLILYLLGFLLDHRVSYASLNEKKVHHQVLGFFRSPDKVADCSPA